MSITQSNLTQQEIQLLQELGLKADSSNLKQELEKIL